MNQKPSPSQPPTVAIALITGLALVVAMTGLIAVVLPDVLLMVIAGFGLLLTFVAQYFLWARWLFPIVQRLEQKKEEKKVKKTSVPFP